MCTYAYIHTYTHTYTHMLTHKLIHTHVHTQVSWEEIHRMLEWLLTNMRIIDIMTGGTDCFYVDLANHVYGSLRVPHLSLQSPRCGVCV